MHVGKQPINLGFENAIQNVLLEMPRLAPITYISTVKVNAHLKFRKPVKYQAWNLRHCQAVSKCLSPYFLPCIPMH